MPTIICDSNEWPRFKHHLKEQGMPAELGFDFMLYTKAGVVVAERKKIPGDLLASVGDGRLASQCAAMREQGDFRFLIPEGTIHYSVDGHVIEDKKPSHWTRTGIRNLLRSIRFVEGVDIEYSKNIPNTISILQELQGYFDTGKHGSYRTRPGLKSDWPVTQYEERYLHWLQGLPGTSVERSLGPATAKRIANVYSNPPALFAAEVEEIEGIKGIGEKTAKGIWGFLHGEAVV